MGYEILDSDFSDFVSSDADVHTSSETADTTQINLITPKGKIYYREHALNPQLSIQESHYAMDDDVTIFGKGEAGLLEIQFNLSEKAIYYEDKAHKPHTAHAMSGNIAFLSAEENQARILFQKDTTYNTFDIHLPLSLLDQYAGESAYLDNFLTQIHRDLSGKLSPESINISPAIYNTIREIKNCRFEGLTKKIYLESKAYELIALLYEHTSRKTPELKLSSKDQERIQLAAAIIQNNLEQPFTIPHLARMAGVNQTKLKTGFKSLFNNTVFGYLQELRMKEAKRYLLDTQLSVQEIATLVGYQSTSNFSAAFKNIYGHSPIQLRTAKI